MQILKPEMLLLIIPMGLGVAFMLWVLWSFWQDQRREHVHQETAAKSSLLVVSQMHSSRF